jgi:hypothetical protein
MSVSDESSTYGSATPRSADPTIDHASTALVTFVRACGGVGSLRRRRPSGAGEQPPQGAAGHRYVSDVTLVGRVVPLGARPVRALMCCFVHDSSLRQRLRA